MVQKCEKLHQNDVGHAKIAENFLGSNFWEQNSRFHNQADILTGNYKLPIEKRNILGGTVLQEIIPAHCVRCKFDFQSLALKGKKTILGLSLIASRICDFFIGQDPLKIGIQKLLS